MSAYLYDEALVEQVREITGDDRIHIITPERAVQFLAQFDKDKVNFPAIVISRNPTMTISDYRNQPAILQGQTAKITEDNVVIKAQLVDLKLSWSIDVFAVDRRTCDEIIRELVFYFLTHSRMSVNIPYDLGISQNFDIQISPEISDNSDLVEFPNRGEYFRETITIYTENAHFFSSSRYYQTFITSKEEVDIPDEN